MFNNLLECLFSQPLGNSLHGFLAVLMLAEGGETDVAFARWTEADTWGADYAGTIKHLFEEFPAWRVVWSLYPDIWGILATINLQAELLELCSHEVGILHIVIDG